LNTWRANKAIREKLSRKQAGLVLACFLLDHRVKGNGRR
jgi:hypothetical protein